MPTGHAKATVGNTIIAETDTWEEVEGNVYFPPASVKTEYLTKTDHSTHCPWKGDASYYNIRAGGELSREHTSCHRDQDEIETDAIAYLTPRLYRPGAARRGVVLCLAQGEG